MTKIKVTAGEPETASEKEITIKMTEDELKLALAWSLKAENYYTDQLVQPSRNTRRALRRGTVTRADIRKQYKNAKAVADKLSAAFLGANAEEIQAALRDLIKGVK